MYYMFSDITLVIVYYYGNIQDNIAACIRPRGIVMLARMGLLHLLEEREN